MSAHGVLECISEPLCATALCSCNSCAVSERIALLSMSSKSAMALESKLQSCRTELQGARQMHQDCQFQLYRLNASFQSAQIQMQCYEDCLTHSAAAASKGVSHAAGSSRGRTIDSNWLYNAELNDSADCLMAACTMRGTATAGIAAWQGRRNAAEEEMLRLEALEARIEADIAHNKSEPKCIRAQSRKGSRHCDRPKSERTKRNRNRSERRKRHKAAIAQVCKPHIHFLCRCADVNGA